MSQPPVYTPQHSFVADSATLANFPGQALDVEFQSVKATTDAIETNIALIQRDDGALGNSTVGYDQLSPSLQTNGLAAAQAWVTATSYIVGAAVIQSNKLYRCLVAHTSGVFATDLAAGNWLFVVGVGLTGPTSSVAGNLPKFHDTGGGILDDSGVALASLAPLASPALTGTPTAPTAAPSTNTTQIATTAYADAIAALKANIASPTFTGTPAAPTATPGTNTTQLATTAYADAIAALKANLVSPTFTGTPAAPTAAVDTNTTQIATTAMVLGQAAAATPLINGAAAVGTSTRFARGDHVHPTDTTRQALLTAGQLPGTATNDNATAGNVGEYSESIVVSGSAVALVSGTAKDVTTLTLGAGDWDLTGAIYYAFPASTSCTITGGSISTTANTFDTTPARSVFHLFPAVVPGAGINLSEVLPVARFSLSGSTTFHLVAQAFFTVSTLSAFGIIRARRVR